MQTGCEDYVFFGALVNAILIMFGRIANIRQVQKNLQAIIKLYLTISLL